ncbi:MAG: RNA chaperone Hfq [Gammaproteobacteria bacterium]
MSQPDDNEPEKPGRVENAQFTMLNRLRREHTRVDVYLVIGTRLQGRIHSFDGRSLLLRTSSGELLLYHHAISSVQPSMNRPRAHASHGAPGHESRQRSESGQPRPRMEPGQSRPYPEPGQPRPRTEPVVVTRRRRIPGAPGEGGGTGGKV